MLPRASNSFKLKACSWNVVFDLVVKLSFPGVKVLQSESLSMNRVNSRRGLYIIINTVTISIYTLTVVNVACVIDAAQTARD